MIQRLKKPNVILFILLLAPFIRPVGLDYYPVVGNLLTLWKLLSLLFLLIMTARFALKTLIKERPWGLFGLILFWVVYTLSCIFKWTDVKAIAAAAVCSVLLFLYIDQQTRNGNGMVLLRGLSILCTVGIWAQILSIILVKSGILWMGYVGESPVYLFGMDNYSAFFIYPMLFVVLFYNSLTKKEFGISGWVLVCAVVGSYLLTKSLAAAGAGVLAVAALLIKPLRKKLPNKWVIPCAIGTMVLLLILICGFQAQNLLAFLLDKSGKGVTLNSRTIIWDYALELIGKRPVFGHGPLSEEQLFNDFSLYGVNHVHNLLLELLLRGGVVGMSGYLLFLCGFAPWNKKGKKATVHPVLMVGLLMQFVMFFMDFYPTILVFYIFMALVYFSKRFEGTAKKERDDIKQMRILYLLFSFTTGGTERLVSDIANEMARREHNVHLYIVNDLYEQSMLDTLDPKVQVQLQKRPVGGGGKLSTLLAVARYIRKNKIQIVHCNSFAAPELLLLKPVFFPNAKVIHTIHGMGQYGTLGKVKCLLRNILCHRFVAISDSVKQDMLTHGAAGKKIRTVYNAINLDKFIPGKTEIEPKVVFGNVARIMPEVKGQDILLDALGKLSLSHPGFHCYFAGGADAAHEAVFENLKKTAIDLGLERRVTFLGNVEDIPAFLKKVDVFVLPSRSEGFGISLIEAMAMGIPCVASRLDGPAEVLREGQYGTLFTPEDSDDLAQKLAQVIENLPQKREVAKEALAYVKETYSIVTMCDKLEQVMKE